MVSLCRLVCSFLQRACAAFALAAAPTLGLHAQTSGSVAGRVTDAGTQLSLASVRVTEVGSSLETYTGRDGAYRLTGVAAGERALVFSYVGYPDTTRRVTVPAGGIASLDVLFEETDVVTLERYVIEGAAVGQARALNQQRAAPTLTRIVAADEIGRFPDQNAAESLQRLPGVALYRDQGEGRFVDLRGLNYIYTSVRLNGANLASPELGDRAIALDVLPSDSLAALEVTKVRTPDQDAEGLGGSVNLRTKSAFDSAERELQVTAQGIYTRLTDEVTPSSTPPFPTSFSTGNSAFSSASPGRSATSARTISRRTAGAGGAFRPPPRNFSARSTSASATMSSTASGPGPTPPSSSSPTPPPVCMRNSPTRASSTRRTATSSTCRSSAVR